ncbi:MAG: hypothetical protein AMJ43_09315 [Coxiella sp. DG_40]|nr:MAG: hypothetical protein AMJ43_09315 [Coxiella sp. DG_40]
MPSAEQRLQINGSKTSRFDFDQISISDTLQYEGDSPDNTVPVVIAKHPTQHKNVSAAIEEMEKLDVIGAKPVCIRIVDIPEDKDRRREARMVTAGFIPGQKHLLPLSPLIDTVGRFLHISYRAFIAAEVRL